MPVIRTPDREFGNRFIFHADRLHGLLKDHNVARLHETGANLTVTHNNHKEHMMFGILIAVGAGFLVPHIEQPVARPIAVQLRKFLTVADTEMTAIAIMTAMFGAAVISAVFDSGSAIGLSVGVFVGYFATRIFAAANAKGR